MPVISMPLHSLSRKTGKWKQLDFLVSNGTVCIFSTTCKKSRNFSLKKMKAEHAYKITLRGPSLPLAITLYCPILSSKCLFCIYHYSSHSVKNEMNISNWNIVGWNTCQIGNILPREQHALLLLQLPKPLLPKLLEIRRFSKAV